MPEAAAGGEKRGERWSVRGEADVVDGHESEVAGEDVGGDEAVD